MIIRKTDRGITSIYKTYCFGIRRLLYRYKICPQMFIIPGINAGFCSVTKKMSNKYEYKNLFKLIYSINIK